MITKLTTFCEATYFWELDDCELVHPEFSVFLNGKPTLTTDKTHFTLRGLDADTSYNIEVFVKKDGAKRLFIAEKLRTKPAPRFVNVRDFGATGDGRTLDTDAIKRAIEACGEGMTLYFPSGTYLTGALTLHSNMDVYLDEGATLQGSDNPEDYLPMIRTRFEGLTVDSYSPLIGIGALDHEGGVNTENIRIYGEGAILGGGAALCQAVIDSETVRLADYLASLGDAIKVYEKPYTIAGRARPRLLGIANSRNVTLSGLTVGNGASWNIQFIYSENILTYNCTITSEGVWNGDGWDPDSSESCTIFNCDFTTGDDGIAIKSGKNPEGDVINRPTKNIRIFDCRFITGHGIAIGSELSGGIDGIYIWDCDASHVVSGFSIKGTRMRGGYAKNIYIRNSKLVRIGIRASVNFNNDGAPAPHPPFFSNLFAENVILTGEYYDKETGEPVEREVLYFDGLDEGEYKIHNVTLKDITVDCHGRRKHHLIDLQSIEGLSIINLKVR